MNLNKINLFFSKVLVSLLVFSLSLSNIQNISAKNVQFNHLASQSRMLDEAEIRKFLATLPPHILKDPQLRTEFTIWETLRREGLEHFFGIDTNDSNRPYILKYGDRIPKFLLGIGNNQDRLIMYHQNKITQVKSDIKLQDIAYGFLLNIENADLDDLLLKPKIGFKKLFSILKNRYVPSFKYAIALIILTAITYFLVEDFLRYIFEHFFGAFIVGLLTFAVGSFFILFRDISLKSVNFLSKWSYNSEISKLINFLERKRVIDEGDGPGDNGSQIISSSA